MTCDRCEAVAHGLASSGPCVCGPNVRCSRADCPWGRDDVKKVGSMTRDTKYLRDRDGSIWITEGGDRACSIDVNGDIRNVLLNSLRELHGPLHILNFSQTVLDQFPTLEPPFNPLKLKHGLYRIFWHSGGSSLASVGSHSDGTRWFAPTNWIVVPSTEWDHVKSVELIEEAGR